MIMEKLYEAMLLPGEVMPTVGSMRVGDGYLREEHSCWPITEFTKQIIVLSKLDPVLYERYKERYWSENTFVSTSA